MCRPLLCSSSERTLTLSVSFSDKVETETEHTYSNNRPINRQITVHILSVQHVIFHSSLQSSKYSSNSAKTLLK